MGFTIASQQTDVAAALLFGASLSALYLAFSAVRRLSRCGTVAVFFFDLFYFFVCTFATVFFFFIVSGGKIRIFMVFAVILGWLLFFHTVGRALSFVVGKCSDFVKKKTYNHLKKKEKCDIMS